MILSIDHVTKKYGSIYALDDLCYSFCEGVHGLLGVNGAGKSTLLSLITDNLVPDAGSIRYAGVSIQKLGRSFRRQLGYMPQQQGFYDHMSAYMFLCYVAELKGLDKKQVRSEIESLLEVTHLSEKSYNKISTLSGGMRQRLLLAQALLGDPKVLILDEPTAGLDPDERIRMRNYISSIAHGKIVLIATHIVSDVEMIADNVVLLKKGKILKAGSPDDLIGLIQGKVAEVDESMFRQHSQSCKLVNIFRFRGQTYYRIVGDDLESLGLIRQDHSSLEDVFHFYSMERCDHV